MASATASKAPLVVAASMSAVEALKDQLGLCRWNYTISNLSRHATNPIARPSSQLRHVSSSAAAAVAVKQIDSEIPSAEEKTRRRRAEKAEKVRNLVCWGPN